MADKEGLHLVKLELIDGQNVPDSSEQYPVLVYLEEYRRRVGRIAYIPTRMEATPFSSRGGIRYYSESAERFSDPRGGRTNLHGDLVRNGWLAEVAPEGRIGSELPSGRARAVEVRRLLAFCIGCQDQPLEQGVVAELRSGFLLPVCSLEKHPDALAKFSFQVDKANSLVLTSF